MVKRYRIFKVTTMIVAEGYTTLGMTRKEFFHMIEKCFTVKKKAILYEYDGHIILLESQARILAQCKR